MDYFLNEFSLTGQFANLDEFYQSFRDNLSKVLKKIEKDGDSAIYKSTCFWSLPVSDKYTVQDALNYKSGKNQRLVSTEQYKSALCRLIRKKPYLEEHQIRNNIVITEHNFDRNEKIHTEKENSIYCVACNNANSRLLSFKHCNYNTWCLRLKIQSDGRSEYDLDIYNIYSDVCWSYLAEIKKWPLLDSKYWIEVRANEVDRHEPHFHVTENRIADMEMVFSVDDCRVLEPSNRDLQQWEKNMLKVVQRWFNKHKLELRNAWDSLHSDMYHQDVEDNDMT